MLGEVAGGKCRRGDPCRRLAARMQAATRPGSTSANAGGARVQSATMLGQRGAKAQPSMDFSARKPGIRSGNA